MQWNGRPPQEPSTLGWALALVILLSVVLWGCIVGLILWALGGVG
jgi:hypothetical protein